MDACSLYPYGDGSIRLADIYRAFNVPPRQPRSGSVTSLPSPAGVPVSPAPSAARATALPQALGVATGSAAHPPWELEEVKDAAGQCLLLDRKTKVELLLLARGDALALEP
jgi:hypothetical protein